MKQTHHVEFGENSLKTERITNEEWLETIKEYGETEVEENPKNGKRPVDILVLAEDRKSKKKFVLSIENKYGSSEHGGQCVDYIKSIKKKYIRDKGCYYFVYLDIKEPPDFEKNKDRYDEYKFLCYEDVMKWLEEQLKTLPESATRLYLEKYVELLKPRYADELDADLSAICSKVPVEDIEKINGIIGSAYDALSADEQIFVDVVKQYREKNKEKADDKVKGILDIIINSKKKSLCQIKSDYGRTSKSAENIKYAYTLELKNKFFKEDGCALKTVDFPYEGKLKVKMVVGLKPSYTKVLLSYIYKTSDFLDKIRNLQENGWTIIPEFIVLDASQLQNNKIFNLYCKSVPSDVEAVVKFLKDKGQGHFVEETWVKDGRKRSKADNGKVKQCKKYLQTVLSKNFIATAQFRKNGEREPFTKETKGNIIEMVNTAVEKKGNRVSPIWAMTFVYTVDDVLDGDKTDAALIFRKKAIEALDVFFGAERAEELFKSEEEIKTLIK